MKTTLYGTRGSVPVAGEKFVKFGGNTTCLRIESSCLPEGAALVVDAGSGIVPLAGALLKEGVKRVILLFTHFHHDHTQGLLLAPITFIKGIQIQAYGPIDHGKGVRDVLQTLMQPPFFPVDFSEVGSHFSCHTLEQVNAMIMIIHPKGGVKVMDVDQFERLTGQGKQIPFRERLAFGIEECLVVRMLRSNHPERTISYRFEERPTQKVFCFLTDHENTAALPQALKRHLAGADLLIQDSQYSREIYETRTAGFGHGTPDYCVKTAVAVGAKKLGLTHHDPGSSDEQVESIFGAALEALKALSEKGGTELRAESVFACQDHQVVEV